jgi:type II secretory pathway pseudopilin PulG
MVELGVSLTVLLILTAIAIPSLMRSFRTYQLNDAAARMSDMLKFTRFEAVRRNKQICFLMKQSAYTWTFGTDSTCSGTLDANGKQQVITGFATILLQSQSGLPGQGPICSLFKSSGVCLNDTLSGINGGAVTFDPRGAVSGLVPYVFYVGSNTDPEFGYRAVVLLPSGTTQIWTAPNGGTWQQVG